jgi:hypothetical protein
MKRLGIDGTAKLPWSLDGQRWPRSPAALRFGDSFR